MGKFTLQNVWDNEVMQASVQWFGKMDLQSLCDTLDRMNTGERPKALTTFTVVSSEQPDYHYPESFLTEALL